MHAQGIDPTTQQNLDSLSTLSLLDNYYLAGGTACALHIGHRISYDLDFFSQTPATPEQIRQELMSIGDVKIDQNDQGTFNGQLGDTKISFFIYPYPLLKPAEIYSEVKVASLDDLVCMKLEAMSSRGVKRDFVDLFFLFQKYSLEEALKLFDQKFSEQNVSSSHVIKSLIYFSDAENDPDPNMLVDYDWNEVKSFFVELVKKFMKSAQ
ncbi:MAG: hypothetical protein COU65_01715 [Candidatus Pacebacteria bacterium CG10_big_fil_rev_8_21_14_0_10_42_12]|nr:MAG: hypothetical protein COU65_01715 [Candidatus Pacebacteria bacterium CG10_big_fil_rev_8_21_14_0_10_42_12]